MPGRALPRSEPFMPPLGLSISLSPLLPAPSWSRVVASAFYSSPRAHLSTAQFGWFGAQLQSTSPPLTWDPTFSLVAASPWNGVPGVQGPCPGSLAPGKEIIPLPFCNVSTATQSMAVGVTDSAVDAEGSQGEGLGVCVPPPLFPSAYPGIEPDQRTTACRVMDGPMEGRMDGWMDR